MRGIRSTAAAVTLTWAAAVACQRADSPSSTPVTTDSSGVSIIEIPDGALRSVPEWGVDSRPLITLGASANDDGSRFFRITGARMLPGDRVAITSDAAKQIAVFDAAGSVRRTVGRSGRGPGEFSHIRAVASSDSKALVAYDEIQMRLSTFHGDSPIPTIVNLASVPGGRIRPVYLYPDGSMLVRRPGPLPAPSAEGVVRGEEEILRVTGGGATIAHFGRHPSDDRILRARPNGGLTGGEPPFGRELHISADDSLVVLSSSGAWIVDVFNSRGKLVRSVRALRPRRAVTADMRQQYRERVLAGVIDDYGVREWTMLSTDDVFPAELPAFDLLRLDDVGAIWTRETGVDGETAARWFIFSSNGHPLAHVQLPADFVPTDISSDRIAGVWTDSLGGEQVHVYSLDRARQ